MIYGSVSVYGQLMKFNGCFGQNFLDVDGFLLGGYKDLIIHVYAYYVYIYIDPNIFRATEHLKSEFSGSWFGYMIYIYIYMNQPQ